MALTIEGTARPGFNNALIVLPSAAYAALQSVDIENMVARGIHLIIDITVKTGTPTSMTVTISGTDPASTKKYTLLASAALTGTGTTILKIFPGAPVSANASANDFIPRKLNIAVAVVGVDGSNNFTYSLGAMLLR